MENNDENNNEKLDFDSVPTLAEMKQKRYEQNGGDPMHELERHPNTSNNSGSKNSDYNDLTNLHRMRIKNNVKRDNINYQSSEEYSEIRNKGAIVGVIIMVLSICITGAIIKYNMESTIAERYETPILNRVDHNAIERSKTDEQRAAEEAMLRRTEELLNGYNIDGDENEVDSFNYKFSRYDGRANVSGEGVNIILKDVDLNNTKYSEEKEIGVNINANDVTGTNYTGVAKRKEDLDFISSKLIDSNRTYTIKCKYNEQGYIYEIDIEENEKN